MIVLTQFQPITETLDLICSKVRHLEHLIYDSDVVEHFMPEVFTVPISIADDKFLNLRQIYVKLHLKSLLVHEEEIRFKLYLTLKCPNLRKPIHIHRKSAISKYYIEFWVEYSTECTKRCTDAKHYDDLEWGVPPSFGPHN